MKGSLKYHFVPNFVSFVTIYQMSKGSMHQQ